MSLSLYAYKNLIKKNTLYAQKMRILSNKIFGEVVRPTSENTKNRILRFLSQEPLYKQDKWVRYYPRHQEIGHLITALRSYGLFRDEHQDFVDEMKRLRALRGKVDRIPGSAKKAKSVLLDTK